MLSSASHPRRSTTVGAVLALFVGLLLFAAPAQAAPTPVTPAAVTFPSLCTVNIPDSRVVKYTATTGGDPADVTPGTHDLRDFFGGSDGVVFTAVPLDGNTLADGATSTWTVTFTFRIANTCFADLGDAELVSTEATCDSLTFTNLTDQDLSILYGDYEDPPSEEAALPGSGTVTIDLGAGHLGFAAVNQHDGRLQFGGVRRLQSCEDDDDGDDPAVDSAGSTAPRAAAHPTAAPAAGVAGDGDGHSVPALALLGALALIAVRRSYALGR